MNGLITKITIVWTLLNILAQVLPGQATLSTGQIHAGTDANNAWEIIGLGGRYGYLSSTFLSKLRLVDSDHFPPSSAYGYARDHNIRNIAVKDMGCVTVANSFHESFFTSKNNLESQCLMEQYFEAGNYYAAIDQNIEWYVTNPARTTGVEREGNLEFIKEGIAGALEIHVKNRLITGDQSRQLMEKHSIKYKMNLNLFLLNIPRRDSARGLIQSNTAQYNHVPNMTPKPKPERSACDLLKKKGRTSTPKPKPIPVGYRSQDRDPNLKKNTCKST